jgi:hypothetical protein
MGGDSASAKRFGRINDEEISGDQSGGGGDSVGKSTRPSGISTKHQPLESWHNGLLVETRATLCILHKQYRLAFRAIDLAKSTGDGLDGHVTLHSALY